MPDPNAFYTTNQTFPTFHVATVATGIALGEMSLSDVNKVISFLAGGPVWTHQLLLVRDEAERAAMEILERLVGRPLGALKKGDDWRAFRAELEQACGTEITIGPATRPFHRIDAVIADLTEQVGDRAIILRR